VGERLRVDEVVDPDPLDVRVALVRRAEDVAADAAEAIDADTYGPWNPSDFALRRRGG
jgi:hypothetical protein